MSPSAGQVPKKVGKPPTKIVGVMGSQIKTWPHDHTQGKEACLWCGIQATVLEKHGKVGWRFLTRLISKSKANVAETQSLRIQLRHLLSKDES